MKRLVSSAFMTMLCLMSAGCAGGCGKTSDKVDLVDLNKVLEVFEKTLSEPDPTPNVPVNTPAKTTAAAPGQPGIPGAPVVGARVPGGPIPGAPVPGAPAAPGGRVGPNAPGTPAGPSAPGAPASVAGKNVAGNNATPAGNAVQPVADNTTKTATFLKKFGDNLNRDLKLESGNTIGVHMMDTGAVEGFIDVNKNGKKDGGDEKHLFRIEVDTARNRLVATDESNPSEVHRRDRQYSYRPGSGLFMGYMMGSMMNRQNNFYSAPGRTKPNFSSMPMSSSNYHSSAVSKARGASAASSSARGSRGGSFRGGGK